MLILENQGKGIWTLQSTTAAEFDMLRNMAKVLRPGDVFGANVQEGKEVCLIISPAKSFPQFTPSSFILSGTTNSDRANMKKLARLALKAGEFLHFESALPGDEVMEMSVCGASCSACAMAISDPDLIDDCLCNTCKAH